MQKQLLVAERGQLQLGRFGEAPAVQPAIQSPIASLAVMAGRGKAMGQGRRQRTIYRLPE